MSGAERESVFIIDASSFIYRAYFASLRDDPIYQYRGDGHPIGAVRKFTDRILHFYTQGVRGFMPSHIAVIFDANRRSWRHDVMPEYKANRSATPDDLKMQLPMMREVCAAFALQPIEMDGYEADDLIASYVRAARQNGVRAMIISADKDLLQLIRPGVSFFDPAQSNREERVFSSVEDVIEKFGVRPELVPDLQALCGDTTDNVSGAPGVGPKTAVELITRWGSLENVFANADKIEKPKLRKTLTDPEVQRQVWRCREVVELDARVPLPYSLHSLQLTEWPAERAVAFMREQGFIGMARRASELFGLEQQT